MHGVKIILDEEKIKRENKYDIDKLYSVLAKYAERNHLIVKDKNTFVCPGTQHDLAYLGNYVYDYLAKLEWLPDNIKEWTWFWEEENYYKDMIKYCTEKKKVGWYAR
ncbi:hypothetical protein CBLAS_1756 [Campylobacter blaseri]|uniref:Uncharacterized protein n=1 Tax=Campylobacter blaseri TaxID=2042961 RepID=A0A2P8R3R9_9BACT|nr:hypothetical protein [Campylobacter blaseri]PSM53151.1 hypothetical protein CQ405_00985 [Campylobacter blaseri]PSM54617.1 hypothetical protein CRN67_00985 [Campylobacter blaseri]QKF86906.1 hypothetical protein CBLAS_1756 [Campylobacter blaseri]